MDLKAADLMVAIVTPFTEANEINYPALDQLTEHLLANGANGFVIGGTTGETPTLSHDEKLALYRHFGALVAGRVPVIAGTGSNNTAETIAFTNEVATIDGIDAALVVVPPYNKPNQRGMLAHFTAVADAVDLPIMIYNIPGRTGVKMEVATLLQLAQHPQIVGVKQCASLPEMQALIEQAPADFAIFSGEDEQALVTKVLGGAGVISVAGHVYITQLRAMYDALAQGDVAKAGQLQRWLTPRMAALFMYPSPSPVKAVLNAQGFAVGGCRLPIVTLNDAEKQELATALQLPASALTDQLPLDLGGDLDA
ncbi:4-hydroxy-tetrahydrodipicolinate synthase [Limosilactobacillus ingluviei]|uniref:4-hydroxy-tetrahydrodipicolinate synthase n=2 Tax=Limosilactobacillus ingluviei TaxID=148604 RepID=A0A0R2H5B8_9LACO|nr:4-hydroxy-tetrahydrodipicolinate synthase [Limosilactobacillus ingluviei]KRL92463.1 dihydrodipicolinate synthase [Limosilactobacillus ingluviei DSM 15946]KRN45292.1 dihydrodipicolinate synthase [Limosilactobacillus ingluviei]MDO4603062.1 4-hydroxy-tetrahydrodipicolinate synthase [Limosilactobacillus ingluviei]